ncbi:MAG: cytochrome C oxidase subunit IV family protein [Elusimicrobiota bacterium]
MKSTSQSDESLNLGVYLALLALTAATLAASLLTQGGRIMAVSLALIIASVKAGLIGFYYMGLRRERMMMFMILAIGVLAVSVLLVGILPDMTFRRF